MAAINDTIIRNISEKKPDDDFDYSQRGQWLRAAVLGANDGLVSVASLMMGVGAVKHDVKAMILTGFAGLVAGACSMAIGEFVSVYSQLDIEVSQMKRERIDGSRNHENETLPNPVQAAAASALAFIFGAIVPLLAASFIVNHGVRLAVVVAAVTVALVVFGWIGAFLGRTPVVKSCVRVLVGGWMAMAITFGLTKLIGSSGLLNLHVAKLSVVIIYIMFGMMMGNSEGRLKVGFYRNTCPDAEAIVGDVVRDSARFNPRVPAFLLRLHFHDCFVQGCDGSILIDNGPISEKLAVGHQGVKGFDVIQNAKAHLEFVCPGVVSCADIVAIAARDAVAFSFGPFYAVETGRRDGVVSNFSLANRMPDSRDSIHLLKQKFFEKRLNAKDLVLLSGAHTIGTTACFFLMERLYNFMPGGGPDPSINPDFLPELIEICPPGGDTNVRLPLDRDSGITFDNHILQNIRSGFAVLQTDAKLLNDPTTKQIVESYFRFHNRTVRPSFEADFVKSMVKMGRIGVKTRSKTGEIRRVCNTSIPDDEEPAQMEMEIPDTLATLHDVHIRDEVSNIKIESDGDVANGAISDDDESTNTDFDHDDQFRLIPSRIDRSMKVIHNTFVHNSIATQDSLARIHSEVQRLSKRASPATAGVDINSPMAGSYNGDATAVEDGSCAPCTEGAVPGMHVSWMSIVHGLGTLITCVGIGTDYGGAAAASEVLDNKSHKSVGVLARDIVGGRDELSRVAHRGGLRFMGNQVGVELQKGHRTLIA
ncbi:hypothetical protein L6452_22757 [Arctium lappa]|uniref:Uncharacterized protein n=1 Tax=Arctium lappa TaxID=4217 RepID=A0ACB9B1J1_ARCLA|nr:hypothetical protein L6452_22757 [Arctium lappa]